MEAISSTLTLLSKECTFGSRLFVFALFPDHKLQNHVA